MHEAFGCRGRIGCEASLPGFRIRPLGPAMVTEKTNKVYDCVRLTRQFAISTFSR
jgi:hypothetical protein